MRTLSFFALALLLVGCPGGGPENAAQNSPSHTSTTTVNPQEVAGNSTAMNPLLPPKAGVASPTFEIHLTEYEIKMPDVLPHGQQTLHIVNLGKQNHSFAIVGNGVAQQLPQALTREDATQMKIDLKPGTYTVYCPVDGHRGKGMQRTITVR